MTRAPACTLDEKTHIYRIGGHIVPHVTAVIRKVLAPMPMAKPGSEMHGIMERARVFGTALHSATEYWDRGTLDMDTLDPALVGPLNSWREFRQKFPGRILANEQSVYSIKYGFAGRLDRLLELADGVTLVDLKSGTGYDAAFGPQTAAYRLAAKEYLKITAVRRMVVMLAQDGFTLHFEENKTDEQVFMQALTCFNWRKKNGTI